MTKKDKKEFINDLVRCIRKALLQKLDRVPEEWDGHELRNWIADAFDREKSDLNLSRRRAFNNAILINDL